MLFEDPRTVTQRQVHFRRSVRNKERPPWDNIQLSKAERKEKTFEQMQELRAQKWERQCKERLQFDPYPPSEVLAVKITDNIEGL